MTDTDKLLAELDTAISKFVVGLAVAPLDELVRRYKMTIELAGEEESQDRTRSYRQQIALIGSIGRYRFRSQFEDAINKAVGE